MTKETEKKPRAPHRSKEELFKERAQIIALKIRNAFIELAALAPKKGYDAAAIQRVFEFCDAESDKAAEAFKTYLAGEGPATEENFDLFAEPVNVKTGDGNVS